MVASLALVELDMGVGAFEAQLVVSASFLRATFLELRNGEVPRIHLPRTQVNKD